MCIPLLYTLLFYTHEGIREKAAAQPESLTVAVQAFPSLWRSTQWRYCHDEGEVRGCAEREYPEASNTPLLVQMKGPHQAKSLYQCKQPLLLWDASQMLGAKMSHH